jgi:hypothetical protein
MRVEFDGLVEEAQGQVAALPCRRAQIRDATQIVVIGIEALGGLAFDRSISALSSFGPMAPTTLAVTLSCKSKMSSSPPS